MHDEPFWGRADIVERIAGDEGKLGVTLDVEDANLVGGNDLDCINLVVIHSPVLSATTRMSMLGRMARSGLK